MIDQLQVFLKSVIPASGIAVILFVGFWFQNVMKQKRRNTLNEIDLSAQKVNFENHTKPIDDLVGDSNKSHAAGGVVETPRADDKKK